MPNPLKTLTPSLTTGALALSLALFWSFGPAHATPIPNVTGLSSLNVEVEDVGYRRSKRDSVYVEDYYGSDYSVRSYRAMPYGGSDEIRELQRLHPETLWPRSMRYFPYR